MSFLPGKDEVVIRYILERYAVERRDKECAHFEGGERWTWRDALDNAYGAANALSARGIRRGDHICIFLPNGPDFLRAWWGLNCLGAVFVPVNVSYKGALLEHVCRDSSSRYIIASADLAARVKELNLDIGVIDAAALAEGAGDFPVLDPPLEPWDLCAIVYTSGTTGASKGVMVTQYHCFKNTYAYHGATSDGTMLVDLPLFHVGGLSSAMAYLAAGGRIAVRSSFSGTRWLDIVRETGATHATLVGTIGAYLAALPPRPDDADNPVERINAGPIPPDPEGFKKRFGIKSIHTGFAMTEVPCPLKSRGDIPLGSCGKAREGVEVRLVDGNDIPVPQGQVGELIVRSHLPWEMSIGYWNRPEETAAAWRNGWFHTGDLLYMDREGNFYYVDRVKDSIRRRGENISSLEVEKAVSAHPNVKNVACVSAPDEYGGEEVKVFVVPHDEAVFDPAELIGFLVPRMPHFMVPRFVQVISEIPKTPSMKVKKFALRKMEGSGTAWDREAAGIRIGKDGIIKPIIRE